MVLIPSGLSTYFFSLFSQVDISLNGTQVTASTNTFPYRAMLETILSYSEDAKKSQLTTALYYADTAGRMDAVDVNNADTRNRGLIARRNYTSGSNVVDTMGRIHATCSFRVDTC